jgi:hypothetical protein
MLAVGANRRTVGTEPNAGEVYIYLRDLAGSWQTTPEIITANAPVVDAEFGAALALSDSGNTLAVCEPTRTVGSLTAAGAVNIFKRSTATASFTTPSTQIVDNPVVELAEFCNAVSVDGDGKQIIVGNALAGASDAGAAVVLTFKDSWLQQKLTAVVPTAAQKFGNAVAISSAGKTIVVAEQNRATSSGVLNAGAFTVFRKDISGTWYVANTATFASAPEVGLNFGAAVSLSTDGKELAVGQSGVKGAVVLH